MKPEYAGKAARCKQCDAPLLIAPDYRDVRLQTGPVAATAASADTPKSGSAGNAQSDLVLGQELFGWKIGQRGALALAAALVLILMLLTMFFTSRAGRAELEKERERARPKSMETE